MAPNEDLQYEGLVQLLLYFGWKWVGFVITDDKHGEHFIQIMEPMLSQNKICSEFTERIDRNFHFYEPSEMVERLVSHVTIFTERTANVIIIHGESTVFMWLVSIILVTSTLSSTTLDTSQKHSTEKPLKCTGDEAIQIPHEWYQDGDLLIGGLMSHVQYMSPSVPFNKHPSEELCTGEEALKIPQEWYQEGELLIGGLMSHIHYLFPEISFKRHPFEESVDLPLENSKCSYNTWRKYSLYVAGLYTAEQDRRAEILLLCLCSLYRKDDIQTNG
ncbi:Vomeronasal type-2 receptor 26, partial [Ophiophagus hannah]